MDTAAFEKANKIYAAGFQEPDLRRVFKDVIVVTCMDPRIQPYEQLGLKLGKAITIRNAGGSAREAVRSIVVAQHFVGSRGEIAVFHHTDCGMSRTTSQELRVSVKEANPGREDVANVVDGMDFYHITHIEDSVKEDVKFLGANPLVIRGTRVSGWVYDVETGKIRKILSLVAGEV